MTETESSLNALIDSAPNGLARTEPPAVELYEFDPKKIATNSYGKPDENSVAFFSRYSNQRSSAARKHVTARDVLKIALETPICYGDFQGGWYLDVFYNMRQALGLGKEQWNNYEKDLLYAASGSGNNWGNLYEAGCIAEDANGKFTTATLSIPWQLHGIPFYQRFNPEETYIWTDGATAALGSFLNMIGKQPDPSRVETSLDRLKRDKLKTAMEKPGEVWWGQALASKKFWHEKPSAKWQFDTRVLKLLSTGLPTLSEAKEVRGYFITAKEGNFLGLKSFEPNFYLGDENWVCRAE